MVAQPSDAKLITIVGETGSGKSALALELAKRFDGEIVSADSWQVYKGFDIGTAKPTRMEQKTIRHHLIDIVEATDGFNAALFKKLANEAIDDIHARAKLPILAGGTALYVDSVLYDYSFLPVVSAKERTVRNNMTLDELLNEAETAGIDLEAVDRRNKRRVIRALEAKGQRPVTSTMRPNTLVLGIKIDRDTLRERLMTRVDSMIDQGLVQEVKQLGEQYGWDVEPMKGIGYREWREYFEGTQNLEQIKQRIVSNTMKQLAKRQRSWFGRNKSIHWVGDPREAVDLATTFLNKIQ